MNTKVALRIALAITVALSAYIHADLYVSGYRYVHVIGLLFLVQAAAGFAVALLLLLGAPWTFYLASLGLATGSLGGFILSRTVGVFGFTEIGWQPAPQAAVSVGAELCTIVLAMIWLIPRARTLIR